MAKFKDDTYGLTVANPVEMNAESLSEYYQNNGTLGRHMQVKASGKPVFVLKSVVSWWRWGSDGTKKKCNVGENIVIDSTGDITFKDDTWIAANLDPLTLVNPMDSRVKFFTDPNTPALKV